jgi:hypothetical protein
LLLWLIAGGNHRRTRHGRRMSLPRMSAADRCTLQRQCHLREGPGSCRRSQHDLHPRRPAGPENPVPFLPGMRHHGLLGPGSATRPYHRRFRCIRRSRLPCTDEIDLGGISTLLGRVWARSRIPTTTRDYKCAQRVATQGLEGLGVNRISMLGTMAPNLLSYSVPFALSTDASVCR